MSQQPQSNEPVFPDATSPYPSQPTQPVPSASGPAYPADAAPPAYPPPAAYPPPPAFPPPAAYPPPTQQSGWSQATDRLTGSAPLTPKDERTLGMLAHLVPLIFFVLSAGTLGFIASIVFYIMYKDRGPFVRAHAANSLNVQIITLIGLIISGFLMLVLIGFLTYPMVCLFAIVVHIIGASKASAGQWYNPPLTPQFVR